MDPLGPDYNPLSVDGTLTFKPSATTPSKIADELDTLLTDGRLGDREKNVMVQAYRTELKRKKWVRYCYSSSTKKWLGLTYGGAGECDKFKAKGFNDARASYRQDVVGTRETGIKQMLKFLTMSAEFHATNLNGDRVEGAGGSRRVAPPPPVSLERPFKAVVVVFMPGGADSFNMLMPHSNCGVKGAKEGSGTGDLHAEYIKVRTNAAIKKADMLPIDVKTGVKQPCGTFAQHPKMKNMQALWKAGTWPRWRTSAGWRIRSPLTSSCSGRRPRSTHLRCSRTT